MLQPGWWQNRSRRTQSPSQTLGVDLQPLPDPPGHVLVSRVERGRPAYGKLLAGDQIIAAEHDRLDAPDPIDQLGRAVIRCRARGMMVITIKRGSEHLDVHIHLPADASQAQLMGDPIAALKRLAIIGEHVQGFRFTLHPTPPLELHASGALTLAPYQPTPAKRLPMPASP
jgi:hypothetical protein